MAVIEQSSEPGQRRRPHEMLIDTDVHPVLREGIGQVLHYMSRRWQAVFRELPQMPAPSGLGNPFPIAENTLTPDALPPEGGPPGSSPTFMVEDFFDRYDVGVGQLILLESIAAAASCADPEMSAVLLAAYNDWMLDEFVIDPRMRYALLVSPEDPELAAAEIARHGSDPRVCSISLSPTGDKYFGDRWYRPIYDAAVEQGLPIMSHTCQFKSVGAEAYVEEWTNRPWGAALQVSSLVTQGTFERYPSLKVMIVEQGYSWIMPLMWRMDASWRRNRRELPWLKRWPGEYIRDHIRLSTQPIDDAPDARSLDWWIESEETGLADLLCYSSDYPHWDTDRPGAVLSRLSDDSKRKIFCDNAKTTLRLG